MRKAKIILLVLLAISLFMTLDLGYNFLASLVPSLNDGIQNRSFFAGIFIDDHEWSQAIFLKVFMYSSIVSIILILVTILTTMNLIKGKNR